MPDPILLEPGDVVPDGIPPDTPIYVKVTPLDADELSGALLPDGCLGTHYPDSNPDCTGA